MKTFESIDIMTAENHYTHVFNTLLDRFPSYLLQLVNDELYIVGELKSNQEIPIDSKMSLHKEVYRILARDYGLKSQYEALTDVSLLKRALKAGLFSVKNVDLFNYLAVNLVREYGIPNPELLIVNGVQRFGIKYTDLIEALRFLYLKYCAWIAEEFDCTDEYPLCTDMNYSYKGLFSNYLYRNMPSEEVRIELALKPNPHIQFIVPNGWLDICSIQLKYLITSNTRRIKICPDCMMPFYPDVRNRQHCFECSTDAKRKARSRMKKKSEKGNLNGKKTSQQ